FRWSRWRNPGHRDWRPGVSGFSCSPRPPPTLWHSDGSVVVHARADLAGAELLEQGGHPFHYGFDKFLPFFAGGFRRVAHRAGFGVAAEPFLEEDGRWRGEIPVEIFGFLKIDVFGGFVELHQIAAQVEQH